MLWTAGVLPEPAQPGQEGRGHVQIVLAGNGFLYRWGAGAAWRALLGCLCTHRLLRVCKLLRPLWPAAHQDVPCDVVKYCCMHVTLR